MNIWRLSWRWERRAILSLSNAAGIGGKPHRLIVVSSLLLTEIASS